jgi:uncharacterized RDD family membrane protein YckC
VTVAPPPPSPALARRIACAVYDLLLVVALVLVATFPFLAFAGDATTGWRRHLLQAYVIAVAGAYFVGFWTRGGQTLPMKTWRIRLERNDGGAVDAGAAVRRYLFALAGGAALGIGYLWAFLDRDGQFLHDRLAGTRLADLREPRQRRSA